MSASLATSSVVPPNSTPSASTSRATKRKLDEALHSLDEALIPSEDAPQVSSSKKARITRSIYSTLAKYGIKSKEPASMDKSSTNLTLKPTPHLSAIVARTALRTRKAMPFKVPSLGKTSTAQTTTVLSSTSEYSPSSISSFLSRLSTFTLSTYANKPAAIDAVAASKCGWRNDGKDRLVCGVCHNSWVVAGREGMSKDATNTLLEKQRASLTQMHKDGCPWKTRQCDPTIYRIPLKHPAALAKEIKSRAFDIEVALDGIEIRHPLTSTQLQSLLSILSTVDLPVETSAEADETETPTHDVQTVSPSDAPKQPSETAILTSLFGWALVPPLQSIASRPGTPSISRSSSVVPSAPGTPVASQSFAFPVSREATPGPSTYETPTQGPSTPGPARPNVPRFASSTSVVPRRSERERDSRILHCGLCQRRVGLWAFTSATTIPVPSTSGTTQRAQLKRQFDVLKEHRSYCPYVVRSTSVPSLPMPVQTLPPSVPANTRIMPTNSVLFPMGNSSASQVNSDSSAHMLEGWRAVLAVVSRNGLGRRQRQRSDRSVILHRTVGVIGDDQNSDVQSECCESPNNTNGERMELDGIEAMVEGVKASGGKDLLRYVKGLLGKND